MRTSFKVALLIAFIMVLVAIMLSWPSPAAAQVVGDSLPVIDPTTGEIVITTFTDVAAAGLLAVIATALLVKYTAFEDLGNKGRLGVFVAACFLVSVLERAFGIQPSASLGATQSAALGVLVTTVLSASLGTAAFKAVKAQPRS